MADEPTDQPDDVLELTETADDEPEAVEQPEQTDEPEAEEVVVGFADEEPPADDPNESSVIRTLRKELRETQKQLRERTAPEKSKVEPGPKPTLEACDYDEETFERELTAYNARKAQVEADERAAQEEQQRVNDSWNQAHQRYQQRKAELALPDFDDAQEAVDKTLGQLSPVILKAARDPAAMVAALGKSPAKLEALAKLKDPFELAAEVARMESSVTVTRNKRAPAIDRAQSGSATTLATGDQVLERLEKEAARTGDRTKVVAHKKAMKAK